MCKEVTWIANNMYKASKIALKLCIREIGCFVEEIQNCVSLAVRKKPADIKNRQDSPVDMWNELTTDERAEVALIYMVTTGLAIWTWVALGIKIFG